MTCPQRSRRPATSFAAAVHAGSTGASPAGEASARMPMRRRPRLRGHLIEEPAWRRGGRIRISGYRAGDRVERSRAVTYRTGHDVTSDKPRPRFAGVGTQ